MKFALLVVFAVTVAMAEVSTLSAVPKDPVAVGNALYEKGDYAGAAEQYRQAVKTYPPGLQRAFAWFNLGNCHVQTKAYNKAIVAYRRAVEDAPNFSRGYQLLGDVCYSLGDVSEAVVAYRRLLELEENSLHAQQMLGECALKTGDVTEALRHLDAAVKLEPDLADLYLAEAEAYARIRDYGSAEKVLRDALLTLSKTTADGYFYLGQLYELDEKPEQAIRAYEEGLLLTPKKGNQGATYYLRIANLQEHAGEDYLALLTLEQGIRAGIEQADFHLQRAAIYFQQQRYDKAKDEFAQAYAMGDPRGRTGLDNVAAALFNAGKSSAPHSGK